jgi:PAS domain-containing protein
MPNFFAAPDKEKNYHSYMVYILTIIWSCVTGLIVLSGFYFFPHIWPRWLTFTCVSLFIAFFNLGLNYLGKTKLASWSLSIMLWLFITIPCFTAGGIMSLGIMSQVSVILTAGFLLGWRGGLSLGILTIVVDFWMAYLETIGQLPPLSVTHNPITRWIGSIIPFGTILALQYYSTNHLRKGLIALQREIRKREDAEKIKDKTLYDLGERVKEMKTLYAVSRILQIEYITIEELYLQIAEVIPPGWQYPEITSALVSVGGTTFKTLNYQTTEYYQHAEMKTTKGTKVQIDVVYSKAMPEMDEGPFLKEERNLINALVEMLIIDLERKERKAELKDYKYALDLGYMVSISKVDGTFIFVNENFCKTSKFNKEELIGNDHSVLWSNVHTPEYFMDLEIALKDGKP